MSWQQCPKCYGQGTVWFPPNMPMNDTFTGDGTPFTCNVCQGKMIINEFGLPPETAKQDTVKKGEK